MNPELYRNLKCVVLFIFGLLGGMSVLAWIELLFAK